MSRVSVKICGLKEPADAAGASEAGADLVGVVFAGWLRRVTAEQAAQVVAALDGRTRAVGVFVDSTPEEILRHRDVAGFQIAQLHGAETPEDARALQAEGLEVWKALRPETRDSLASEWVDFAGVAGAILVEGFSPEAPGGTGSSFPHEWLTDLDRGDARLVLAGGLHAENVAAAIASTRPDVVDVSSGVEDAPGVKSLARIREFLEAARGASPAPTRGVSEDDKADGPP